MLKARAQTGRRPRRPLLAVVGASIVVNAAFGIYAIVVPHFGSLQGKVLATSACVTGAGVLTLACLPAWERGRLSLLPRLGVTAAPLGFTLIVIGLWAGIDNEAYARSLGTVLVVAVACVLACVLALAELAPRYRRVLPVANALAVVLGAMLVGGIWSGFPGGWFPRAAGVVAVLLAAASVSVPILHRASRSEPRAASPAEPALRFCPACGHPVVPAELGETSCTACGNSFQVRYLGSG